MIPSSDSTSITDPLAFAATLSGDLAASSDINYTIRRVLGEMVKALKAQAGALFLYDEEEKNLICRASVGPVSIEGQSIPFGEGLVGSAIARDRIISTHDAYREKDFHNAMDQNTGFVTASLICAPLRIGDKAIGAVEILNKVDGYPFGQQDEDLLKVAASSAALAISHARATTQLVEQESLKREIELASAIQRSLLPREHPDLPLRGFNRAARQISGDFYDYFQLPGGKIAFALGDVSGKGMNAALLTAKTASIFRCIGKAMTDPGRLLTILNREIAETQTQGMFVTMIAGYYDPKDQQILIANAGHLPALVLRADGSIQRYEADTPPLGIMPEIRFTPRTIDMSNAQLLIFSDGLNEWKQGDQELGIEGVEKLFIKYKDTSLANRISLMMADTGMDKNQADDDVTLLMLDAALSPSPHLLPSQKPLAPTQQIVDLRLNADPSNLKLARGLLKATAEAQDFSEEEIDDILLAVTEALENVMVHAYEKKGEGEIILSLSRIENGLKVHIRDFGPKVTPEQVKPRDLSQIRPGGLGTHFIEQIMDKVEFLPLSEGEGNLLEMIKMRKEAS